MAVFAVDAAMRALKVITSVFAVVTSKLAVSTDGFPVDGVVVSALMFSVAL